MECFIFTTGEGKPAKPKEVYKGPALFACGHTEHYEFEVDELTSIKYVLASLKALCLCQECAAKQPLD
jgi:hypothetical protein